MPLDPIISSESSFDSILRSRLLACLFMCDTLTSIGRIRFLEFPDYMSKAEEHKSQTGVSNIYLISDDGKVIKSTEQYKNFQFQ